MFATRPRPLASMALPMAMLAGACLAAGEVRTEDLFDPPQALVNQDGKVIVTKLGNGHPLVMDFNGDGKNDILLGCKKAMMTVRVQGLLLRNVGTNTQPRFEWPTRSSIKLKGAEMTFTCSGGCNTGAAFEAHPIDWNGDGKLDLVVNSYSSTGTGAFLLLNSGAVGGVPTFIRKQKVFAIRSHGWGSGGGDWNNDGLPDFAHNVNHLGWRVHLGTRRPDGRVEFAKGPSLLSTSYRIIGHEPYRRPNRKALPWFNFAPYAGNFSGLHAPAGKLLEIETHGCPKCRHKIKMSAGSSVVELVASMADPVNRGKSHLNYYWLDHKAKTCTLKGRLAEVDANSVRVSLGDLNGDGSTDILYSGGVGGRQRDNTRIWVMYGKVKGTAARPARRKAVPAALPPAQALPAGRAHAAPVDLKKLFAPPAALTDRLGKVIVTRRAAGHPVIFDWNADGNNDLLLGCYTDMTGKASEILFVENVGTRDAPKFQWPAKRSMKTLKMPNSDTPYTMAVAHRGSATLEVHPVDQNGDGFFDLMVNTGKHRGMDVFLIHNTGRSRTDPTFGVFSRFQNIVRGLPQCSGGGDWNGDGVADYAHLVNPEGWQIHFGLSQTKGLPRFGVQADMSSSAYRLVGQDKWFDRTPHAWNFSGLHGPDPKAVGTLNQTCRFCGGRMRCRMHWPVTEIVASMDVGGAKDPGGRKSSINYYWLDHAAGTCMLKGTLATTDMGAARLSIGDLNHDGRMDVVYTGGLSATGEDTGIYVLYGKVKNVAR